MNRLAGVLGGLLGLAATAAGQDLSGHWTGGLPQDDRTFIFTMQVDVEQVGDKLRGTSRLTDNRGTWSVEQFSGTVTGTRVFLQESQVLDYKPGTVNNWCIKTLDGELIATDSTLTITGYWRAPKCAPGQFTISKAAPAPVRQPVAGPAVSPAADGVVVNKNVVLQKVLFERTNAVLLPTSRLELNRLVDILAARPALRIVLDGHADKVGPAVKNLTLSQQRAQAVKSYLVAHGVSEARISTNGYGDTRLICPPPCPANQRVEFTLLLAE